MENQTHFPWSKHSASISTPQHKQQHYGDHPVPIGFPKRICTDLLLLTLNCPEIFAESIAKFHKFFGALDIDETSLPTPRTGMMETIITSWLFQYNSLLRLFYFQIRNWFLFRCAKSASLGTARILYEVGCLPFCSEIYTIRSQGFVCFGFQCECVYHLGMMLKTSTWMRVDRARDERTFPDCHGHPFLKWKYYGAGKITGRKFNLGCLLVFRLIFYLLDFNSMEIFCIESLNANIGQTDKTVSISICVQPSSTFAIQWRKGEGAEQKTVVGR